jgi:tetratricopeptide (TPR) repeat protein
MAKNKKNNYEVNEFDEALVASKSFFEKNKKAIVYGGGALLAIIIAALLIHQFYIVPRGQKANESLFAAQELFMNGEYEKALNGDGQNMGFLAVADEFGSTKAGNLAHLYAGLCLYQTDKFQEAIEQLEDFSSCGDDMVSPSVIGTIANCYAELGQNEKAVEMLVKAAKKADNNTLSPIYLIQAGQIYESLNQNDKALDCYNQIKTKYQQSMQYNEIDKYIERVKK